MESIEVRSRAQLRAWLSENHLQPDSVWLVTFKKSTPEFYVSTDEVVSELLCFGWIDSVIGRVDEQRSKLLISPRKPKSGWSRVNKLKLEVIEREGLMTAAGQAVIDRAKADGSWTKLDAIENLEQPPELVAAFAANDVARQNWEAFPRSAKRGQLEQLINAKTPATRLKRVAEIVRYAEFNCRYGFPGEAEKLEARLQNRGS